MESLDNEWYIMSMSDNEKVEQAGIAMTIEDTLKMFQQPVGGPEQISLSLMENVAILDKKKLDDILKNSPEEVTLAIRVIQKHNLAEGEKQIQAQQIAQYLRENKIDANNLAALLRPELKP